MTEDWTVDEFNEMLQYCVIPRAVMYLYLHTLVSLSSFLLRVSELDVVHVCTEVRMYCNGLIYFVQTSQQVHKTAFEAY
jgi:hypothetical protein